MQPLKLLRCCYASVDATELRKLLVLPNVFELAVRKVCELYQGRTVPPSRQEYNIGECFILGAISLDIQEHFFQESSLHFLDLITSMKVSVSSCDSRLKLNIFS